MKHPLRSGHVIVILGLLLAACERPDLELQKKLVGSWSRGESFEMTFGPEGKFQSQFAGEDKELNFNGDWLVSNRCVVLTVTGISRRNYTNPTSVSIGDITLFRIVSLNTVDLVMEGDGQTNTYNRKGFAER